MGSKKPKMEVTEYYLSVHFGICAGPIDALLSLTFGEKYGWRGKKTTSQAFGINKVDLFGGVKKEGGVAGIVNYLAGEPSQIMPEHLATRLGLTSATCPAYRGISSLFLHGNSGGFYWTANTPYLKGLWAEVSRAPVGLSSQNAMIARGVASNISLYFLLDRSNSLSTSDFQVIKNAVISSLEFLEGHIEANPEARVDIGVRFYSSGSSAIERTHCDAADIAAIKNFIASAGQVTGGDVLAAMNHAQSWFNASRSVKFDKRSLILVTDSDTEDGMTAASVGPAADMLDQSSGAFSISNETAVDMYAVNYVSTNTTWTSLLDNTPEDGVPVIGAGDQSGLTKAVATVLNSRYYDANPAHIIYECLTNTDWGMGAPPSIINISSFLAAADTLFDERLGLSLLWTQQSTIEDFVSIVINHIEATLFIDPRTGLFTLKLIRGDYDIDTLPVLNESNSTISNVQRKLWAETTNEIVVSWTNHETEETETVVAQDLANIAMQGGVVSDSKDYSGVRSARLAMQLAMRDLRVASSPLVICQLTVNRSGWSIVPGDVVVVEWPEHGIERVPMRVGPVDYGRTTDSKITLSLTEDVFGLPVGEYTTPPDTEWVSTDEWPAPIECPRTIPPLTSPSTSSTSMSVAFTIRSESPTDLSCRMVCPLPAVIEGGAEPRSDEAAHFSTSKRPSSNSPGLRNHHSPSPSR